MKDSRYYQQVRLLLSVLPIISLEPQFALKGGTAINLFIRDMPRLSVDIDLTYLPIEPREASLDGIHEGVKRIEKDIESKIKDVRVTFVQLKGVSVPTTLNVQTRDASIIVETNLVLRGSVYPAEVRGLCTSAQDTFEMYTEVQTLSVADIYGGKLCAALDRQHPRDLFDVMLLLADQGITDEIRKAFIVYLASHSRPMHELLDPYWKDISEMFSKEFAGMTREPVELSSLLSAREDMLVEIKRGITSNEKQFLISMKEDKEPSWHLLGFDGIENLPGLQWKLLNIQKMSSDKREIALEKLKKVLS